ncbi:esterase [Alloscardovia macacae]|uniref:alpha/beta hydrolase n=1 Tax=Alloscardovia macacae TaxID=1160091 RepID=UPI000A2DDBF9|nr:alpha/beta hydrolase [Alloscardovia macacae]OTA27603.1 esterase [Alloscardovia macacae]
MISQNALDLFAANRAAMAAGDAPHLSAQVLPGPDAVSVMRDVAYVSSAEGTSLSEQMLDVYRPAGVATEHPLPVILDFHGGGLYYGSKENNACRDMRLAEKGFAVVNANYRLVPEVSFPTQLQDAMRALVWIRDHADEYGFDLENVFVTGDSAGGALALYLCAANSSAALAGALGLGAVGGVNGASGASSVSSVSGVDVRGLVVTSGMFRLTGGVHATALSYYGEGYFQTPRDHILMKPYLDLDKLIVDAGASFPPVFMMTSVEDFIADNTYELARIFHARHRDHALKVWPRGRERALGHVFHIVQAGDPSARQASEAIEDIAQFCRAYVR